MRPLAPRRGHGPTLAGFVALMGACALSSTARTTSGGGLQGKTDRLMTVEDFQSLPAQPEDLRIPYGKDPVQYGDLRIPSGDGPHPVAVLVHGGCWKAAYATLRDLSPMADALKADGIATWNIEYRRLPQPGSGWPGTFLDVGAAVDHLRTIAPRHRLDLRRVVTVGHSAGGHLATWVAARRRLPATSPLAIADPLPIAGVVSLAGASDLAAFRHAPAISCADGVDPLVGGTPSAVPDRYAQASPTQLLPIGVPQVLIWGRRDDIVPPRLAEDYVKAAKKAGDDVRLEMMPALGHFEVASPLSPAWPAVRDAIRALLKRPLAI